MTITRSEIATSPRPSLTPDLHDGGPLQESSPEPHLVAVVAVNEMDNFTLLEKGKSGTSELQDESDVDANIHRPKMEQDYDLAALCVVC